LAILSDHQGWILQTDSSAYVLGISAQGHLIHRYWGPRLAVLTDYPDIQDPQAMDSFNLPENRRCYELGTSEGADFREPCITVRYADGVRDLQLRFLHAELDDQHDTLKIQLVDAPYGLQIRVCYRVLNTVDLIERWVEVSNAGSQPVEMGRIFSAQWHLPDLSAYWLSYVCGQWCDEMRWHHELISGGKKVLESRRLTSGHCGNPWFAVDDGQSSETQGQVWFGTLAWSGNWKTTFEFTENQTLHVLSGLNDWDFNWRLKPGETFTSPHAVAGTTTAGFGGASRALHDYIREEVLPHGKLNRKVIYNSWEATTFDVDVDSQIRLATLAAEMGVELFVLDDGWFHGRKADSAGLGDWWPDEVKFPLGLKPLISAVKQLDMDFGLWIEPEMVNPDSDLYRQHPEWVFHYPGRARTLARNQLILNLARPDVQEHLITVLDGLLSENEIDFIKWDMNRTISEPGWADAPGDARELWVRYVHGLYHIWGTLRARHPQVIFQSCSGGGGRADLGILAYADQIWVSDNTEATARLKIQEGFTRLFPAAVMESWVTDQNAALIPLSFSFHVSMCGVLGVGANILHWTPEQRQEAKTWIASYKTHRQLILWGDRFVLRSAYQHPVSAVLYLDKARLQGILFVFRTYLSEPAALPVIYFEGLLAQQLYEIAGVLKSGAAWQQEGLQISLQNFESQMILVQAR
jgi:alpha-galactosidase